MGTRRRTGGASDDLQLAETWGGGGPLAPGPSWPQPQKPGHPSPQLWSDLEGSA